MNKNMDKVEAWKNITYDEDLKKKVKTMYLYVLREIRFMFRNEST